jgi:phosphatidylethanolamine-binding protein (PEBP) family uncharacterized protein
MHWTDPIELLLTFIFKNSKEHDAKSFIRTTPALTPFPEQSIIVTSPIGPSGSILPVEYTQLGANAFPPLTWATNDPSLQPKIKEYLLISEDFDSPLKPIMHGLYYGIPINKTSLHAEDFVRLGEDGNVLKGGFNYGANLRRTVYSGPKPLLNHGPHRYVYTVVALGEVLDERNLGEAPGKEVLGREIDGKVVGWGQWIGVFERKWE